MPSIRVESLESRFAPALLGPLFHTVAQIAPESPRPPLLANVVNLLGNTVNNTVGLVGSTTARAVSLVGSTLNNPASLLGKAVGLVGNTARDVADLVGGTVEGVVETVQPGVDAHPPAIDTPVNVPPVTPPNPEVPTVTPPVGESPPATVPGVAPTSPPPGPAVPDAPGPTPVAVSPSQPPSGRVVAPNVILAPAATSRPEEFVGEDSADPADLAFIPAAELPGRDSPKLLAMPVGYASGDEEVGNDAGVIADVAAAVGVLAFPTAEASSFPLAPGNLLTDVSPSDILPVEIVADVRDRVFAVIRAADDVLPWWVYGAAAGAAASLWFARRGRRQALRAETALRLGLSN